MNLTRTLSQAFARIAWCAFVRITNGWPIHVSLSDLKAQTLQSQYLSHSWFALDQVVAQYTYFKSGMKATNTNRPTWTPAQSTDLTRGGTILWQLWGLTSPHGSLQKGQSWLKTANSFSVGLLTMLWWMSWLLGRFSCSGSTEPCIVLPILLLWLHRPRHWEAKVWFKRLTLAHYPWFE